MTEYKFEELFESGKFDDEYSEYIMEHCHGDRIICNGDTLIEAIEDGYLYEDFKEMMMEKLNNV